MGHKDIDSFVQLFLDDSTQVASSTRQTPVTELSRIEDTTLCFWLWPRSLSAFALNAPLYGVSARGITKRGRSSPQPSPREDAPGPALERPGRATPPEQEGGSTSFAERLPSKEAAKGGLDAGCRSPMPPADARPEASRFEDAEFRTTSQQKQSSVKVEAAQRKSSTCKGAESGHQPVLCMVPDIAILSETSCKDEDPCILGAPRRVNQRLGWPF